MVVADLDHNQRSVGHYVDRTHATTAVRFATVAVLPDHEQPYPSTARICGNVTSPAGYRIFARRVRLRICRPLMSVSANSSSEPSTSLSPAASSIVRQIAAREAWSRSG